MQKSGKRQFAVLTLAAMMLSGCASFDPSRDAARDNLLLDGAGADISPDTALKYVVNQDRYLKIFARAGGVAPDHDGQYYFANFTDDDWVAVTAAGVIYIRGQCDDYLHAIWELNRARVATNTEITSMGTLAAAVLGIAKASSPAIAITASAFGFASATSENLYSSLLYQLDPSSVDSLVHSSLDAAAATIDATKQAGDIKDRNSAVSSLRLFLSVCMPQSIEATVNLAVKNAKVDVTPQNPENAAPPAPPAAPKPAKVAPVAAPAVAPAASLPSSSTPLAPTKLQVSPAPKS